MRKDFYSQPNVCHMLIAEPLMLSSFISDNSICFSTGADFRKFGFYYCI